MNINRNLKDFADPYVLRQRLLAYSIIDVIMNADNDYEDSVYHCNTNWRPGQALFTIDDYTGDYFNVLFAPEGCIIKGFAHESELSPYNKEARGDFRHDYYSRVPAALAKYLDDIELNKDEVTFCAWRRKDDIWHAPKMLIPGNWDDGSQTFLEYAGDLKTYLEWFCSYYEVKNADRYLLEQILKGTEVTANMVQKLNPKAPVQKVLDEIAAVIRGASGDLMLAAEPLDEPEDEPLELETLVPEAERMESLEPQKPLQPVAPLEPVKEYDTAKPDWFRAEPQWIKDVLDK